jgi:hypothetical protein
MEKFKKQIPEFWAETSKDGCLEQLIPIMD